MQRGAINFVLGTIPFIVTAIPQDEQNYSKRIFITSSRINKTIEFTSAGES